MDKPPSRHRLPAHDPRRDLDELDFAREPESRRAPTGQDWAEAPVTVRDLLAYASAVTEIRTEQVTQRAQIKDLQAWRDADRSGELAVAKSRLHELEAEQRHKAEQAKRDEADAMIQRAMARSARIWQVIILVAGFALGLISAAITKRC